MPEGSGYPSLRMGPTDSKDGDAEILALRRGWWREHWRPMVVLAVIAAIVLALWWPRTPPTIELPPFETSAPRPKLKRPTTAVGGPILEFNGMELSSVVQVLNWRGGVQYVIVEESLGELPVTGKFRQDDVEGFVKLLERELGVTGERRQDGVVWLKKERKD